jgi:hypothetical protein
VTANDAALLILRKNRMRKRLRTATPVEPGLFVFIVSWILFGRLRDAQLIDSNLVLWRVDGVTVEGVPGPRTLGAPIFSYVLLLLLGWVALSTPVKVRFKLSNPTDMSLDEVRNFIGDIIRQEPLDPEVANRLRQRVQQARSFAGIVRAVYDAYL